MKLITSLSLLASSCCVMAQQSTETEFTPASQRAIELTQHTILVDTHIDVPYRLEHQWEDVSQAAGGDFDYPRAVKGGLNAPFMSIYTPMH